MPASIFAGSKVKTLKSTLNLNGGADIISSTTNPQSSAVSAEPGSLLLNTTSGIMYRKLDAGSTTNWVEVGSGAGTKNYIKNPDFDGGATTNWSMKKVSLSSLIPTGNIGTADAGHTIATSSSNPLEGANSLLVQGASLFTAGNCLVSDAFAIDRQDQAKVMGWSFYYEAVTANMDFPGTSAGTWAVYIAEVTTATPDTVVSWIQPAGVYNFTQGTGAGLASGTFQTTATGTAYRLVLVCINSEAAATTLKVDDFQLGPQKVVYGSPVTDWQSYTGATVIDDATGSDIGSYTVNYFYARRVGDSLEIKVRVTSSADRVNTNKLCVTFPNQFQINTTGIGDGLYGTAIYYIPATGSIFTNCQRSSALRNGINFNKANGDQYTVGEFDNGSIMIAQALVPIAGLSSSVQMSNDTDTRVVAARYTTTASNSTLNGAITHLDFNTVRYDTHSAGTGGAGSGKNYIIPVSGYYKISGSIALTSAAWTAGASRYVQLHMNGPELILLGFYPITASATNNLIVNGSITSYFTAGQSIRLEMQNQTGNTVTTSGDTASNYFQVERVSGPATIAASETVAASYTNSSGQTIPSGINVRLDFNNKIYDTHGMFSNGASYNAITGTWATNPKITLPISGKYSIKFYSFWASDTVTQQKIRAAQFVKNGSAIVQVESIQAYTGTYFPSNVILVKDVSFVAGDTLEFIVFQNEAVNGGLGTTQRNIYNSGVYTYFEIVRVGN